MIFERPQLFQMVVKRGISAIWWWWCSSEVLLYFERLLETFDRPFSIFENAVYASVL